MPIYGRSRSHNIEDLNSTAAEVWNVAKQITFTNYVSPQLKLSRIFPDHRLMVANIAHTLQIAASTMLLLLSTVQN